MPQERPVFFIDLIKTHPEHFFQRRLIYRLLRIISGHRLLFVRNTDLKGVFCTSADFILNRQRSDQGSVNVAFFFQFTQGCFRRRFSRFNILAWHPTTSIVTIASLMFIIPQHLGNCCMYHFWISIWTTPETSSPILPWHAHLVALYQGVLLFVDHPDRCVGIVVFHQINCFQIYCISDCTWPSFLYCFIQ